MRNWMTDRWAIVNESIAPKAYMFPRNSALPGMIVMQATKPNKRIPTHGVLKRGCSRLRRSGTWRCSPIEYTSLDAPMMPALVAMNRIVAASNPT